MFELDAILFALGLASIPAAWRVIYWLRSDRRDLAEGRVVRNMTIAWVFALVFLGGFHVLYKSTLEFVPVESVLYLKDNRLHGVVVERFEQSGRATFHDLRLTLFDFSENRRLKQLEPWTWGAYPDGAKLYFGRSGRVIWVAYSVRGLLAISADTLEVLANEATIVARTPGLNPAEIRTRVFDAFSERPQIATGNGRIWSINPLTFQGELISGTAPDQAGFYPERIETAIYTCEGRRVPHSVRGLEHRSESFHPQKPPERQAYVAYQNQGPVLIPTTHDSRILGALDDDFILAESDGVQVVVQRLRAESQPARGLWRIALPSRALAGGCQLDGDSFAFIVQSGSAAFPEYALRRVNIRSGTLQE